MLLTVKNLSISFETDNGTFQAVRNLSFQLDKNKILGVVGESGCGKSITNLALMGLLPPEAIVTADELTFDGLNLLELSEKKWSVVRGKKIGMIFQDPMTALNPCFTVRYQLEEAIRYNHIGIPSDQVYPMALDLLSMVGIPDPKSRIECYPYELSGGMAQRIMIAMAISGHPKLLIADEPTTALDVTIQLQILKLLKEIQEKNNMSIIFVSHDLNVISKISDKIQVMYAGEIIESGSKTKIINEHKHPYTKGLLESLPGHKKSTEKLFSIPGIVPDLKNRPTGCQFSPRCEYSTSDCESNKTIEINDHDGQQWRCLNPISRQN